MNCNMIMEEERMIKSLASEGEKKEDHLKSIEEVRQENERLKSAISQIMKNYRSLKRHFHDIVQQDQSQKSTDLAASGDESDLVSLSLGRFSRDHKWEQKNNSDKIKRQEERKLDGLELGLDCKFHSIEDSKNLSPENSSDESKEEENNVSRKGSKAAIIGDNEILEYNPLKKPRVSVRLVCNTLTMNDGCQWRKYGQKVAKGNPCPRAYYRCTVSSSCPVRKQVQRCAQDMSVLTTTYEGTHNHPLPPSAASLASATSAAAAMLNCGSTISPPVHRGSATSSATPNLLTFNLPSSNNLTARTSITTSQSHPTVILDLTAPNHTSSHDNYSSSSLFSTSTHYPQPSVYNRLIQASQQGIMNDNIAAATKAITCNPTFQSALAAAISSFVGSGSISNLDQERKNFKWGENINFSQPFVADGVSRAI